MSESTAYVRDRAIPPARLAVVAGLTLALILAGSLPVYSAGASLSPSTQNRQYGQTASWQAAWGHVAPYKVVFAYGDGGLAVINSTSATGTTFHRQFYPCPDAQTYLQQLAIEELSTGLAAYAEASTWVNTTDPCWTE